MPTEPDPKIEKLIETYAKERREQAGPPLELSFTARKRLQEAVDRKFGQKTGSIWVLGAFFQHFWPRMALVSGAVALILCFVLLNRPASTPKVQTMAKSEVSAPVLAKEKNFVRVAPSSPPAGGASSVGAVAKTRSQPSAAAAPQPAARLDGYLAYDKAAGNGQLANKKDSLVVQNEPVYKLEAPTKASAPQRRFRQLENINNLYADGPPTPEVLTSFRIEREGQIIRVIDSDGSIYSGTITLPQPKIMGGRESTATTVSSLNFAVSGTNQTTKKSVTFSGSLVESLASRDQADTKTVGDRARTGATIHGQLRIGNNAVSTVDATESE